MSPFGKNIKLIFNGLVINCSVAGPQDAQVIIFIHGFPLNKSMWDVQVKALENNYRVVAYDIRGHGSSSGGYEEFSMDLLADDLLALMDKLHITKAILCGLSMGGYIALNAITKHPERFVGLVLCDTQCTADTAEGKEKRVKTIESIRQNGVENFAGESIKNLFAPGSFINRKDEIESVRRMIVETSEQTLCSTLGALAAREETCSKLGSIGVPVLIIVGKEDKITPSSSALFMKEQIKNSLLVVLEDAGHLSNLENPGVFNAHFIEFMKHFNAGV